MLKRVTTGSSGKKVGTKVVSLGIGHNINKTELAEIASPPSDKNVIFVDDFDQLPTVAERLPNDACKGINTCNLLSS